MVKVVEVQISNFRESLVLGQRACMLGLLVTGLAYYASYVDDGEKLPRAPFIGVDFSSLESLKLVLLVLYLASGLAAWFSMDRAYQILRDIDDLRVAAAVAKYPCLLASSIWLRISLAAGLIGVSHIFLPSIIDVDGFLKYMLAAVLSAPFFSALSIGGDILQRSRETAHENPSSDQRS